MKKLLFFTVLIQFAVFSFAQEDIRDNLTNRSKFVSDDSGDEPVFVEEDAKNQIVESRSRVLNNISNKYIFIEGTADSEDHLEFFMTNFFIEAGGAGYTVTEGRDEAAHTVMFAVTANADSSDGQEDNQYVIRISLIRNIDEFEIVSFDFFFTELLEVYAYNRMLFQNATLYIPPFSEEDLILTQMQNNRWKNKWIYLRASFDYPITFYSLQSYGLMSGQGLYRRDASGNIQTSPINHEVVAAPGATLGIEVQFLDFMSAEFNYQISMGDTRNKFFINMASGVELKFPVKFESIILTPYAASLFFFNPSDIFEEFPDFAFGAGFQFSAKGGSMGAFFIDVNYMFSFTEAIMHNPYLAYPEKQQLFPEPAVIHYKRSSLKIGVGYKIGFFDRSRR